MRYDFCYILDRSKWFWIIWTQRNASNCRIGLLISTYFNWSKLINEIYNNDTAHTSTPTKLLNYCSTIIVGCSAETCKMCMVLVTPRTCNHQTILLLSDLIEWADERFVSLSGVISKYQAFYEMKHTDWMSETYIFGQGHVKVLTLIWFEILLI